MRLEDFLKRWRLSVAELEHRASAGSEAGRAFSGEPTVEFQAIQAAIQREARVVVTHFGLEGFDFAMTRSIVSRPNGRRMADHPPYLHGLR